MLNVTVLTDNLVRKPGLLAEHGLSLWLETDSSRVLFDTGQSGVYLHNAGQLGVDLGKATAIVLSHGHYDHGGGLALLPDAIRWPRVFAHPGAFRPKYALAGADGIRHSVGLPWKVEDLAGLDSRLMYNTATIQVAPDMVACAGIPWVTAFETPAAGLLADVDGQAVQDLMADEQILICPLPRGLAVILGCSHPGVVNCLEYARRLYPGREILAVIGGMHLERADGNRLQNVFDAFISLGVRQVVPLHCTGQEVICTMRQALGDRVVLACAGSRITVGQPAR